jgi:hypothetical protein
MREGGKEGRREGGKEGSGGADGFLRTLVEVSGGLSKSQTFPLANKKAE